MPPKAPAASKASSAAKGKKAAPKTHAQPPQPNPRLPTATETGRSQRPITKTDRLRQQEEEENAKVAARIAKQRKAASREETAKRRAREQEEDEAESYLHEPPIVRSGNGARKKANAATAPSQGFRSGTSTSGTQARDREAPVPIERGAQPIAKASAASRTTAKKTQASAHVFKDAENLFDSDNDVEMVLHDDDDNQDDDNDGNVEPEGDIAMDDEDEDEPPAQTSEFDDSGIEDLDQDDEDEDGAISKVLVSSRVANKPAARGKDQTASEDGTRVRPKLSQLDPFSRFIVEGCQTLYRADISNQDAFPNNQTDCNSVRDAWDRMCNEEDGLALELDSDKEKMIKARGSQMRGEVKYKARNLVAIYYGIVDLKDKPDAKTLIRREIESLLDRQAFVYGDPKDRVGFYQNKVIQTIINDVWFHNRKADGVALHEDYCRPGIGLSPFLIALVCTAIECCLDEWETGDRIKIQFSAAMYEEKYRSHCNTLSNIASRRGGPAALKKLCVKIMKNAMKHAGIDPANVNGEIQLDDAELDAALADLEQISDDDD